MQMKILVDPELSANTLAILLAIVGPMSGSGQASWQSFVTIAAITKLSKTTVIREMQLMVARGIILTRGGSAGSGHSTRSRLNIEGAVWPDDDPAPEAQNGTEADLSTDQNGTEADLLIAKAAPIKGTEADLNVKVSKNSKRADRPSLTTIIDRPVPVPRERETSDASPSNPARSIAEPSLNAPDGAENPRVDKRLAASSLNECARFRANAAGADATLIATTLRFREEDFQLLRDIYPNKEDEAGSRLAYAMALRDGATVDALMTPVRRYASNWSGIGGRPLAKFIASGHWREAQRRALKIGNGR